MSLYAYKGFDKDLKCRGLQYEIGKTYVFDGPPIKCNQGFHYCTSLKDVFNYYPRYELFVHRSTVPRLNDFRYCIVEVLGDVDGQTSLFSDTKGATNKIRIVKELNQDEIDDILNKTEGIYLLNFKEEE